MSKSDIIFNQLCLLFEKKEYKEVKNYFSKNKNYFSHKVPEIASMCIANEDKYLNILKELKNIKSNFNLESFYIYFDKEYELIKNSTLKELELYMSAISNSDQVIEVIFKLNDEDKKELMFINYQKKLYLNQYILINKLEKYYYIVRNNLKDTNKNSNFIIQSYFIEYFNENINDEKLNDLFKEMDIYQINSIKELSNLFFENNLNLKNVLLLQDEYQKNKERLLKLLEKLIQLKKSNSRYSITNEDMKIKIQKLEELLNMKIILENF